MASLLANLLPFDQEPGDSNISQQSAAENAVSSETVKPKKYSQKSRLVTGKSQNWLARFFQVKPAIRVIALNASKVKARKDVYKKLLAWKQYGMEEVYLDKINSVIHGKVGEGNCKQRKRKAYTIPPELI